MWKHVSFVLSFFFCATSVLGDSLCATNNGGCGANANCYDNGPSSVNCVCFTGYYMSGGTCVAINACATNNGNCHALATCSTTPGTWSVTCACPAGYNGNGYYCELAVDLCQTNNGNCGPHADCYGGVNAPVTCVCHSGYDTVSGACVIHNQCATNNGGCSSHASCSTTLGTYDVTCACTLPYVGNGWWCVMGSHVLTSLGVFGSDTGGFLAYPLSQLPCGIFHLFVAKPSNPSTFVDTVGDVLELGTYSYALKGTGGFGAVGVTSRADLVISGTALSVPNHGTASATINGVLVTATFEWKNSNADAASYTDSVATCGFGADGFLYSFGTLTIIVGAYAPTVQGGESVSATGLELRVRAGNCGEGGAGTCVDVNGHTNLYSGNQLGMNKYVTPCDVQGTGLNCGNTPTSVHGFLLEVNGFLFSGGFQTPQFIPNINHNNNAATALGITEDHAAIIDGYIFGARNTDVFYLGIADDVLRVMVDFNQDGVFTADEWGGVTQGASTLTTGHFTTPGCRRLHAGFYNGPSLRIFILASIPSADPSSIQSAGNYIVPASKFFKTAADCPVCSCPAGFYISADCTPTTNAVCTRCCDVSKCAGSDTADPAPNCEAGTWDCPKPAQSFFDWRYPTPACGSLTVNYPASLPDGQSNDVNVRLYTNVGDVTLNFHNDNACWTGTQVFNYLTHPNFPAGVHSYTIEWVQVGGSNCHWTPAQGSPVQCTLP